jgi:drug/metabolite transporter (DMT)-like permease
VKEKTLRWVVGGLAALLVLAWSFNYIAGKIALEHLDPVTLVSFRLVLAGVVYLTLFLSTPRPVRIGWRDVPRFILLGIFGVAINQGGFTVALAFTSVGHVAIILAMGPVLVMLLARIIGQETLTPVKVAGVALAFSGIALLAIHQGLSVHAGGLTGDLIAMCAAVGFAVFTVFGKRVRHRFDAIGLNTFTHLTGAVLLLPLAIHQGLNLDWQGVAWQGWVAMSYMAIFSSVFGYLIFYKLLGYLSATQVSSLNYLLPIVATTLGVLLLDERLSRAFFIAAVLVLLGVWLAQRTRWQTPPAD